MIPPLIVQEALAQGIGLIAITDHNATANFKAVKKAAKDTGLAVMPGMELQTREEVHVLCLFEDEDQLEEWQKLVESTLPNIENDTEHFGEQFVVDETGEFIRRETQLLLTSSNLSINEAWNRVAALGGMMIPAHVNRTAFGVIANLGFIPTDIQIEALEISRHIQPDQAKKTFPQIDGYPLIQSGDVHRLDEFLGTTVFEIATPTISELRMAFTHLDNRTCNIIIDKDITNN
jgi:PHP family Zn ribbon phosphoesterase